MPTTLQCVLRCWGATSLVTRVYSVVGTFLVLLLLIFVIYSIMWKVWCVQHERGWSGAKAWGDAPFAQDLGECKQEKSLFSF